MAFLRLMTLAAGLSALFSAGQREAGAETAKFPDYRDPVAGMGVNIHFIDARPGELEMMARAGFHWIRTDLTWESTEKTPGAYDFAGYDRLMNSLDRLHIRALLILDYGNPLYDNGVSPHTEAGRAAFARWAVAAVAHFQKRGVIWEIWNEPNGGTFWSPRTIPEDYTKLALAVNQAIHREFPREVITGPALSGPDMPFIETLGKAGVFADWSAISIHPYDRRGPESYGRAYESTRALIKQYGRGRNIEVLCGESGYSDVWKNMDGERQGQYLARMFLFNILAGVPVTIWYDWVDDGTDAKDPEHHFGTVHQQYHGSATEVFERKPAYQAACTYAHELGGLHFERRVETASTNDFTLLFKSHSRQCLAVWTTARGARDVTVSAPVGAYTVVRFDGTKDADAVADQHGLVLHLDGGPRYIEKVTSE